MNHHSGKIKLIILIIIFSVIIAIGVIGIVGGRSVLHRAKEETTQNIQSQFAGLLNTAKKKFLQMLPSDYDSIYASKTFDSFIKASQQGKIRANMAMEQLFPYLQQSLGDRQLTKEEADSVLKLMEKVILQ